MSRRPARFTEADLNRAMKVAGKCDYPVAVEILPDGTIRLIPQPALVEIAPDPHLELASDAVIEL